MPTEDGRFKGTSPMLRAAITNMGPAALLAQDGVEVLVATIRQQPVHCEVFTHLGVDLGSRAIVAAVRPRAGKRRAGRDQWQRS